MSGRSSRDLRKAASEAAGQAKAYIAPAVDAVVRYARQTEEIAAGAVKAASILAERVTALEDEARRMREQTLAGRLRWLIRG